MAIKLDSRRTLFFGNCREKKTLRRLLAGLVRETFPVYKVQSLV